MNINVKTEIRDQHPPRMDPGAVDDGMHTTSDFVKKLFKYVSCWRPVAPFSSSLV